MTTSYMLNIEPIMPPEKSQPQDQDVPSLLWALTCAVSDLRSTIETRFPCAEPTPPEQSTIHHAPQVLAHHATRPVHSLDQVLRDAQIQVLGHQTPSHQEGAFAPIAHFLGKHFSILEPWYHKIKRASQDGHIAKLSLEQANRETIGLMVRFSALLHDNGMATEYHYAREPRRQLVLRPSQSPSIRNFLLGGWLEYHVRTVVSQHAPTAETMYNLTALLPNEKQVEFDLLMILNGQLIIVECKTGSYQAWLSRLHLISEVLRPHRCVLVLAAQPPQNICQNLSDIFSVSIVSPQDIAQHLESLSREEPHAKTEADSPLLPL